MQGRVGGQLINRPAQIETISSCRISYSRGSQSCKIFLAFSLFSACSAKWYGLCPLSSFFQGSAPAAMSLSIKSSLPHSAFCKHFSGGQAPCSSRRTASASFKFYKLRSNVILSKWCLRFASAPTSTRLCATG